MRKKGFHLAAIWILAGAPLVAAPPPIFRRHPKTPPNIIANSGGALGMEKGEAGNWQTPAVLRHRMSKTRGTLRITGQGVEFAPEKGASLRWPWQEINTFYLTPVELAVTGYENRAWHIPGDRTYRFALATALPPALAARLAAQVGKPAKNAIPEAGASGFAAIPARHTTRGGGSNGVLHFRDDGIEYVTPSRKDGRSWRWADIQTIANPDAYHFRVGAYREIYEFELKQPMPKQVFDRLWNGVYAQSLSLAVDGGLK